MYIYLLVQTLQCEQKHIIHESLLQTFNSPVSQLLLCPEWLWCHYKCHSSFMLENSHARHSILAVFFLYGMVIRPPGNFLLHIYGSGLIVDFISSASVVLYNIIITLIGEKRAGLYVAVYQWACTLVGSHILCLPIWLYANGNMWFMMFTLPHHHCSFITDKDLTHRIYEFDHIKKN